VSGASPAVPSAQAGPVVKLPTLGVSGAGIVTGVDARALRTCAPGRSCDVQVTVQLTPQRRPTRLRWHLAAVDLCTARARTLGHSAITVPAQADHAVVVQTVRLPRATALAVGAVTDRPARAASTPFPAPSGHVTC
ncbi:MAG: hypothetical protein ACXV3V_03835, partial [Actinomycetes bacterium]